MKASKYLEETHKGQTKQEEAQKEESHRTPVTHTKPK